MVKLTDRPAMTIAVDLGRKATKQTNNSVCSHDIHSSHKKQTTYLDKKYWLDKD